MPDNTRRARDEAFWQTFADRYDVQAGPINLENGYFGRMSRTVIDEYQRNIELINRGNSVHVRQSDLAGNVSAATAFSFSFDTGAPSVALGSQSAQLVEAGGGLGPGAGIIRAAMGDRSA